MKCFATSQTYNLESFQRKVKLQFAEKKSHHKTAPYKATTFATKNRCGDVILRRKLLSALNFEGLSRADQNNT